MSGGRKKCRATDCKVLVDAICLLHATDPKGQERYVKLGFCRDHAMQHLQGETPHLKPHSATYYRWRLTNA